MSRKKFKTQASAGLFRILIGMMLGLGVLAGTVYAKVTPQLLPPDPGTETPFMTLENVADPKTTFGWNEQPFSYVLLPEILPDQKLELTWIWKYEGKKVAKERETFTQIASLAYWNGLTDWDRLRKAGDWTVIAKWKYAGSRYTESAVRRFFVTPEPIGAALFLLGGLALTLGKRFRSRA